jgi:RimJ/RimL family protein N-acetyltransferase
VIVATTERLALRRFTLDDAPAFMELTNEPEVRRYTGAEPYASVTEAEAMIETLLERYKRDGFGRWVVERRADGEFLGWCGLRPVEREGVDLGFWILPRHWNQGYATEAAVASVALAFGEFDLPYLLGRAVAANVASMTVLGRLGFEPWLKTKGHGYDDVRYSILRRQDAPSPDPSIGVACSVGDLTARVLQPADQLDFFMLEGNPNVLEYADGELYSYEQAGEAIERLQNPEADLQVWAVSSAERPFVGTVATVVDGERIEIGYRLLEACWGRGLGNPLGELALAVAKREYPGRTIFGRCNLRNAASMSVAEKLGGRRLADRDGHAEWEW